MRDTDEITQMLCQSAEDFVVAGNDRSRQRQNLGQPLDIQRELWRSMADLGWLGLSLPERFGGAEMDAYAAASLCEIFGRHLFESPYIAAALLPAAVLSTIHSDSAAALAEGLASGEMLLSLAWQEHSNPVDLPLPSTRVEKGLLRGRKVFVAAVEEDSILLVYAEQGGKPVLVAVDANADGISLKRFATAQGSYSDVLFDGVQLRDAKPLLSGNAALVALSEAICLARIASSAQLAGIARGCLEQTVEYVNQRVQFGHPIGAFQSVKHRCVDLRIGVELADASWREAAEQMSDGSAAAWASVCAAKARCSDVARRIGKEAVQLHGAMGFTEECDIGLFLRAALQYSSWLGTPVKMRRQFMALTKNDFSPAEAVYA